MMGICKLVDELNRLRKSSSESIDGIGSFDDFKKYMHVSRKAEEDLIEILRKVALSGKKTLVLLCGSAGDGKSHLLSYLKNDLHLLENYTVYNDATESSAPSKTAIETLYEALVDFSDENIENPGNNFILAINLGVLSNFIESEYGASFRKLYQHVVSSNILTNKINEGGYIENSPFQHVSFSDYHMYSLTKDGIHPVYLEAILSRIFNKEEKNPFFTVYKNECQICPLSEKCPVKHNFEFLTKNENREFIANSLVEVIVKDKEILTTREILNYVYDIVVAPSFNYKKMAQASTNTVSFLKEYVRDITPTLMYEYTDMSVLMNQLKKYDPLLERSEEADEAAIFYYVSSDVRKEITDTFGKESYGEILCKNTAIAKINDDKTLKAQIFSALVRINAMRNRMSVGAAYSSFLRNLYYYNIGKTRKLGELYNLVEAAITQWCGSTPDGNICFDEIHEGITLYEKIDFEPYLEDLPNQNASEELQRFLPFVTVKYENKKTGEIVVLDIDYSLYEMIYRLEKGYIQTTDDRNNHADFISFIEKILKTGSSEKELTVITDDNKKAVIEKTKFGYKFKVVK